MSEHKRKRFVDDFRDYSQNTIGLYNIGVVGHQLGPSDWRRIQKLLKNEVFRSLYVIGQSKKKIAEAVADSTGLPFTYKDLNHAVEKLGVRIGTTN